MLYNTENKRFYDCCEQFFKQVLLHTAIHPHPPFPFFWIYFQKVSDYSFIHSYRSYKMDFLNQVFHYKYFRQKIIIQDLISFFSKPDLKSTLKLRLTKFHKIKFPTLGSKMHVSFVNEELVL
jgi:hypothetical protein